MESRGLVLQEQKLVNALGSVTAVKQATREDLALLTWLPSGVADAIYQRFHSS